MKKLLMLTVLFAALVTGIVRYSSGSFPFYLPPQTAQQKSADPADETRAVWVATAYAIDYPSEPTANAQALRQRCTELLDTVKKNHCNTVYLQVRPSCDALYPSKLFPWSKYLTGHRGKAPEDSFDPLQYWIEQAHARGIKLHAWINPYRICAGQYAQADFEALPAQSPAKQHPAWVVRHESGYYFDPGIPEVRKLIADGVSEIVKTYDVDGIQFDDYFYPSPDFDDASSFSAYGNGKKQADWRRENVNDLVRTVGEIVHTQARNPNCVFGISPSGIWRNQSVQTMNGSRTHGYEHYTSAYADSLTWIKNSWIDYICPQIYWEIGHDAADFDTLAHWWAEQTRQTDVETIIGLAAYRIGDGTSNAVWQSDGCGEISRQIDLIHEIDGIGGYALFSYRNLEQTNGLSKILQTK